MIRNLIFAPNDGGKTVRIMHEIHTLVVLGRGREVLVVFPNINYLSWWQPTWHDRFPHSPMVDYVTINNYATKMRGRYYAKIYVEDVDIYPDGISDWRFQEMSYSLRSIYGDDEMIFTCAPNPLNSRTHNRLTTSQALAKRLLANMKYERTLQLAKLIAEVPIEEA